MRYSGPQADGIDPGAEIPAATTPASAQALPAAVFGGGEGRKGDEGRRAAIDGVAPESPRATRGPRELRL